MVVEHYVFFFAPIGDPYEQICGKYIRENADMSNKKESEYTLSPKV